MNTPSLSVVLRAVEVACEEANVALVLPGDNRREPVLYALAAANAATGRGWSLQHARDNVSVTLPGVPAVIDLLAGVPYVGPILAGLSSQLRRTTIYFSPAAMRDPWALWSTFKHESGHVGSIKQGQLPWCVLYGVLPIVTAAAEAPCYGLDMAIRHRFQGVPVAQVESDALASLANYGADEPLYRGIIASHARMLGEGADPGGIIAETERELREAGWDG